MMTGNGFYSHPARAAQLDHGFVQTSFAGSSNNFNAAVLVPADLGVGL
ncbi:hypothetical protein [Rhodohalobacter sp.]|nr:hypothetical protein [Rhodohalobacter sp.]MDZ7756302.1 hypothetical protein [Rhodohalobacter sp.]